MHIDHGEEEAGMRTPDHNDKRVESRRRFLKTMAAGSGAAAVALSAGSAVAGVREETQPETPAGKHGYRETRHVQDYYAKAGF